MEYEVRHGESGESRTEGEKEKREGGERNTEERVCEEADESGIGQSTDKPFLRQQFCSTATNIYLKQRNKEEITAKYV